MPTDKERLDWLEAHALTEKMALDGGWEVAFTDGKYVRTANGPTIRAAVDKAMKTERAHKQRVKL